MKKGDTDTIIQIVGAIIIVVFIAYVTWSFIFGRKVPEVEGIDTNKKVETFGGTNCKESYECDSNPDGSKCLQISDPNYPERPLMICSCLKNEDCASTDDVARSGKCGQDNKCS